MLFRSATAEGFAQQLEKDITSILDELAPVCTSTKRQGKPESRWLSDEAVDAKRARHRLERKWKSTGSEAVRGAYRAACRVANRLIMNSRRTFYAACHRVIKRPTFTVALCERSLAHER